MTKKTRSQTEKELVAKELARRELERRHQDKRDNFGEFVKYFFEKEKRKEFIWNWHHQLIGDELEKLMADEFELLIINMPPRHGKTEVITKMFPVWWLGNNPDYEIISTGYSASLTQTFSSEARDYYNSETFDTIFPRKSKLKDDQNTKEYWKNEDGGFYYATGAGGTITGRGGNLIVIDDPSNPNDAEASSGVKLDAINTWFSNTMMSRRNTKFVNGKKITGKIVIVMQRIHDNDLCGYIQRQYPEFFEGKNWRVLSLKAVAEEDETHRKEGEALFPQMYDLATLSTIKKAMASERGLNFFSAQYQQNPIDLENAEFKREYIQYKSIEEMEGLCKKGVIAIDPAESEKESADYRAISVWGRTLTGEYCKMTEVFGRWSTSDFIDNIFNVQNTYKFNVVLEINKSKLIGEMIRSEMKRRSQFFTMEEIVNKGRKEERIRSTMQPLYQNYQIFHEKGIAYGEGEDELLRFPRSAHDDIIDADEMAVRNLRDQGFRPPDHRKNAMAINRLTKNDPAYL